MISAAALIGGLCVCVWTMCMRMDCKATSAKSSSIKIFQAMAMAIQDF